MKQPKFLEETPVAKLDKHGHEVPDGKPMVIPSGFKRPETLAEQVARLVRSDLSRQAAQQGFETFDESEDFEVDDDFDPHTPFEEIFDPILGRGVTPHELTTHEKQYRKRYIEAQQRFFDAEDTMYRLRAGAPFQPKNSPAARERDEVKGGRPGGAPPAAKPVEEA